MTWGYAFYYLNSLKVEKKKQKKNVVQPHAYSLASRYYTFRWAAGFPQKTIFGFELGQ
jgi:hypothetical protein